MSPDHEVAKGQVGIGPAVGTLPSNPPNPAFIR